MHSAISNLHDLSEFLVKRSTVILQIYPNLNRRCSLCSTWMFCWIYKTHWKYGAYNCMKWVTCNNADKAPCSLRWVVHKSMLFYSPHSSLSWETNRTLCLCDPVLFYWLYQDDMVSFLCDCFDWHPLRGGLPTPLSTPRLDIWMCNKGNDMDVW